MAVKPQRRHKQPLVLSRRRGLSARALLFMLLCAPSVSACCSGDSEHLTLGIGSQGPSGITTPLWGEIMESSPLPYLTASFGQDERPQGDVFELTLDASRIPLLVTEIPWEANPDKAGGCPHHEQSYEPGDPLEPGAYTLVHRRRSGTGKPINCLNACPWTEIDGEPALKLTLLVSAGDSADGGVEGGP